MKKRITLVTCVIILSIVYFTLDIKDIKKGQIFNDNKEEITKNSEEQNKITIPVGLYKNYRNGKERELINEYIALWEYHKDISSFEVYYTNEALISSKNQIKLFDEYRNIYENIEDYKIGYFISFELDHKNIEKIITSPKDTESFYDYLEIYLYDDYHRDGGWYSHTTEEEFNKETLLTSIKLTSGKQISEITSDITLTAFLYKEDDDLNEDLINENSYTITVKRKSNY